MKPLFPLIGILAALAAPAIAQPADAAPATFSDVRPDHWAAAAVGTLAVLGIFTGYPDGTFGGPRAVTRYEAALALQRLQAVIERRIAEHARQGAGAGAAAPIPTPPAAPAAAPAVSAAELAELRRGQEQLRRDVSELQRRFGDLRARAAGVGREVDALREQLGKVELMKDR